MEKGIAIACEMCTFEVICHYLCAHCDKESRFSWSMDISFDVFMTLYSSLSLAHSLTLDETCLG